jgi:acylphosphatase
MSEREGGSFPGGWISERWLVSGRVQGVGFRFHVKMAARRHGLTGDVRNLPDGRVEVRAQGPAEPMAALLATVRGGPPGSRVDEVETTRLDPNIRFDRFDIR